MKELTKEDERLISIQSKEIVHNFIKSYGENPIDYDEVFYNKKQSIGINLISYLKDLAEDILTKNTKPLVDEITTLEAKLKAADSVNEVLKTVIDSVCSIVDKKNYEEDSQLHDIYKIVNKSTN